MGKLEGKVIAITGAASGIGKATSILSAIEGATVALCDVVDEQGKDVQDEITGSGGKARYYHLDVAKESSVKNTFETISRDFGLLYGLVNNAGITGLRTPTHELEEAEWDRIFAINVKGVFFCTKYAIP